MAYVSGQRNALLLQITWVVWCVERVAELELQLREESLNEVQVCVEEARLAIASTFAAAVQWYVVMRWVHVSVWRIWIG